MKLFPTGNQIVFISRQSDNLSMDYSKIIRSIEANESVSESTVKIKIKVLTKRQEKDTGSFLSSAFSNGLFILKQMKALATSRVAIVDGYSIPVSILKHKRKIIVIQIWHAIGAIKKMGLQTVPYMNDRDKSIAKVLKMHNGYSYAIAPSEKCGDFYKEAFDMDSSQIKVLGTPHLDYLYYGENDKRNEIRNSYPQLEGKKVILYIPTYRSAGNNEGNEHKERISEQKDEFDVIERLNESVDFEKYSLIVKPHPIDYKRYQFDSNQNSNIITITDAFTAEELLSVGDYVITDYSSVAFDAGLLKVPLYFYVYDIEEYKQRNGLNIDIENEYGKYAARGAKDIISLIDEEYDFEYMKEFIGKYISCYDGKCTEELSAYITSFVAKNHS